MATSFVTHHISYHQNKYDGESPLGNDDIHAKLHRNRSQGWNARTCNSIQVINWTDEAKWYTILNANDITLVISRIFHIIVLLCGETMVIGGFPLQRESNADLWCNPNQWSPIGRHAIIWTSDGLFLWGSFLLITCWNIIGVVYAKQIGQKNLWCGAEATINLNAHNSTAVM